MSLTRQVVHGLKWTAGVRLLSQAVAWACTLIVMRLLSPSDYGLMALAGFFMMLFGLVSDLGVGSALVQAPELEGRSLRQAFGVVLLTNLGIMAALMALAPLFAMAAGEPRLTAVVQALALQFLPASLSVVPEALLKRELRFRPVSLVEFGASAAGAATTLGLAIAGAGVWTLVAGTLAIATAKAIGLNALAPPRVVPTFDFRGAGRFVTFGGRVTAAGVLWVLYTEADVFFAGRMLGAKPAGFYSVSKQLASLPLERCSQILNQVLYSAFARIQGDVAKVAAQALRSVRLIAFVILPVSWGMSAVARDGLTLLLGERWEPAVLPLQVLGLVIPFRLAASFMMTVAQSRGRADVPLRVSIVSAMVMPAAFWVGCHYGVNGLAMVWVLAYPCVLAFNLSQTSATVDLRARDVIQTMLPSAAAGLIMAGLVVASREFWPASWPALAKVSAMVALGVTLYTGLTLAFNREPVQEILNLLRGASPPAAAPAAAEPA